MNSTRHQQLLSLIKRIISEALLEVNHETLHTVVVTNVHLSNDGREARVWVDAPQEHIEQLNKDFRREIQSILTKRLARKVVPRVVFVRDTGEFDRMDALLDRLEDKP